MTATTHTKEREKQSPHYTTTPLYQPPPTSKHTLVETDKTQSCGLGKRYASLIPLAAPSFHHSIASSNLQPVSKIKNPNEERKSTKIQHRKETKPKKFRQRFPPIPYPFI
jgi:hypothetical protein